MEVDCSTTNKRSSDSWESSPTKRRETDNLVCTYDPDDFKTLQFFISCLNNPVVFYRSTKEDLVKTLNAIDGYKFLQSQDILYLASLAHKNGLDWIAEYFRNEVVSKFNISHNLSPSFLSFFQ